METVLLGKNILKRFIVIKPSGFLAGYVNGSDSGIVRPAEFSVFSPLVKIEVERATSHPQYFHLRFCHYNRYWARTQLELGLALVPLLAESKEPEEDITKSSCTLFEAVGVRNNNDGRLIHLIHVQSGRYVVATALSLFLRAIPESELPGANHLGLESPVLFHVNWDELVKLPKFIALKGHNQRYLGGTRRSNTNSLQLSFPDGKAQQCIQDVHLMNDGQVRIRSLHFDRFWRRRSNNNWIVADATNTQDSVRDRDTLFWPVKTGDNTIAFRNVGNNRVCVAESNDYLLASSTTTTDVGSFDMEELVFWRRVYNVRYRVDNGRVFNQAPFVAGTTTARNDANTEASIAVEVTYEESRSETFTRSVSLTGGVTTTFEAGVPLIGKTGFEFTLESNVTNEWNKTTTTTVSVKASGSVSVPPRTVATINYVGLRGTCDVPFTYIQQSQSSTDSKITQSEEIDGVFIGVNAYDFEFLISDTRSLPLSDEEVMLSAATESGDSEAQ